MLRKDIIDGFRIGIPIALGYFAVAFSLGIIAKQAGLTAVIGFVSSFLTRASAGEYGVYTLVAAQATYVEIVAMCLVVNLRYMLMSLTRSSASLSPVWVTVHLPTPILPPSSPPCSGPQAVRLASWLVGCCPPTS